METNIIGIRELCSMKDCELATEAVKLMEKFGLSGDALAAYYAYKLLLDENAFTLAAERGEADGTLSELVEVELSSLLDVYLEKRAAMEKLTEYRAGRALENRASRRISRLASALTESSTAIGRGWTFTAKLRSELAAGGAGEFGLYDAFRVRDGALVGVDEYAPKPLDSLVGCEEQKRALLANTEAFVSRQAANNVLLYGDAGTGKSTSVKALTLDFADRGLRIIEPDRARYDMLGDLFGSLRSRALRFVIFLDDLSFEENETEYKYLKAIIDGGVDARPDNVLLYATSNRVHLVRESFADRDGHPLDIHRADTVEEKLSLSARFGLTLFYPAPDTALYLGIVRRLARDAGIDMPEDRLDSLALRWATAQHKKSGRTAEQFVRSLSLGYTE